MKHKLLSWCVVLAVSVLAFSGVVFADADFKRGDSNADCSFNIADAIYILQWLFANGPDFMCYDAADADDDGIIDIYDAVYLLNYLFIGGAVNPPPPYPFPDCGPDPTTPVDTLTCDSYPYCFQDPPVLRDDRFELSFSTPSAVRGEPGSRVQFKVTVQARAPEGIAGWSLGVVTSGGDCEIIEATTDGTVAEGVYLEYTEVTTGEENEGAISSIGLFYNEGFELLELPSIFDEDLLHLTLEVVIPDVGYDICKLEFFDGLAGQGQPVDNLLVVEGQSILPVLGEAEIVIRGPVLVGTDINGSLPLGRITPGITFDDYTIDGGGADIWGNADQFFRTQGVGNLW
jgi:hypothetical protein